MTRTVEEIVAEASDFSMEDVDAMTDQVETIEQKLAFEPDTLADPYQDLPEFEDEETQDETEESAYDQEPMVVGEDAADNSLRILAYWEREAERLEQRRNHEIAQLLLRTRILQQVYAINQRMDRLKERAERKAAWHRQGLEAFLDSTKKKKVQLVYGDLKWRKGSTQLTVVDEEAALAWAKEDPERAKCLKVSERFMVSEAKKLLKDTGEEPPGTELVTNPDKFVIELANRQA